MPCSVFCPEVFALFALLFQQHGVLSHVCFYVFFSPLLSLRTQSFYIDYPCRGFIRSHWEHGCETAENDMHIFKFFTITNMYCMAYEYIQTYRHHSHSTHSLSLSPTSANHLTCPQGKDDRRTTVSECYVAISPWGQIVNNIVMPWKARSKTSASPYAMSRQVWGQGHCVTWWVLSQTLLWRLGIPSPAVSPTYLCNFKTQYHDWKSFEVHCVLSDQGMT